MSKFNNPENQNGKAEDGSTVQISAKTSNPFPWVVVENPGTDDEYIGGDFATFREAFNNGKTWYGQDEDWIVMRRNDDGTLTTEF